MSMRPSLLASRARSGMDQSIAADAAAELIVLVFIAMSLPTSAAVAVNLLTSVPALGRITMATVADPLAGIVPRLQVWPLQLPWLELLEMKLALPAVIALVTDTPVASFTSSPFEIVAV